MHSLLTHLINLHEVFRIHFISIHSDDDQEHGGPLWLNRKFKNIFNFTPASLKAITPIGLDVSQNKRYTG